MIQRYPINAVLDIRGHCTDLHLVRKRLFHDMPKPKLLLNVNVSIIPTTAPLLIFLWKNRI